MKGFYPTLYLFFIDYISAYKTQANPACKDLILSVAAKSTRNKDLPPFNSTEPGAIGTYLRSFNASNLPSKTVSGIFNISATYCKPANPIEERVGSIQLLLHGLSATKEYWNGFNYPNSTYPGEYSWVHHATSQGYSTLAIDNLGNGASEHPDPISIVQTPLQIEIIKEIMSSLRRNKFSCIDQSYNKVIMVSHSYGSIVARTLAIEYPSNGADAYILTSTSANIVGLNALIANFRPRSASVASPINHGNFQLGYQLVSPSAIRETTFSLPGDYDPGMLAWEETIPHIFSIGEIAVPRNNGTSEFSGPIMVITGRNDVIVCSTTANTTITAPDCGVGKWSNPGLEREVFPNATSFEIYVPDRTNHNINLHYSSGEGFGAAHGFLESAGF